MVVISVPTTEGNIGANGKKNPIIRIFLNCSNKTAKHTAELWTTQSKLVLLYYFYDGKNFLIFNSDIIWIPKHLIYILRNVMHDKNLSPREYAHIVLRREDKQDKNYE